MATFPIARVHRDELEAEIQKTLNNLGPEVFHAVYYIGEDSTGDPAIFFRIVLTDAFINMDKLSEQSWAISSKITEALHPLEDWGLIPYFNFRSESEHRSRPSPVWTINGLPR